MYTHIFITYTISLLICHSINVLHNYYNNFIVPFRNFETINTAPIKPGLIAVNRSTSHHQDYQTIAIVNDDNKTDIQILHYSSGQIVKMDDTSDLNTTAQGDKITKMAFGYNSNTLYVAHEKGGIVEIDIDKRSVNPINVDDTTLKSPSLFVDQCSSVYLYSEKEIHKLDVENTITAYLKCSKKLCHKGTTTIDCDGNIHSLIRKPFCSEHSVSVCTRDGEQLRSYGEGLLFYGDSLAISKNGCTVAGEGDCVYVFYPDGRLYKILKGFGFVSSLDINDDMLFVTDSWNKRVVFLRLSLPPLPLYEQCIRETILHLNDLSISKLPTRFQKQLEDWNFRVRVEIWTTKELEIAFTEVYRNQDMPITRGRLESRAVITNSKSFILKLKLGISFIAVRRIISARLHKCGDIDLYTRRHTIPNKLPECGILKEEHNKIAAIFVS